jgi:hypothetical protein
MPFRSVVVVVVNVPLSEKVPLGPVSGAEKVTNAPEAGVPMLSKTTAWKGSANVLRGGVLCGVPPIALMLPGGPGTVYS